jgi:hypothetical protein
MQRFSNKIQLMYAHINNDIHFEGNLKNSQELISENSTRDFLIKHNSSKSRSNDENQDIHTNQILRSASVSSTPSDEMNSLGEVKPSLGAPFLSKMNKTKSVNDILQESGVQMASKSESTEEDMVVYNVFSSIESKCTSIHPIFPFQSEPIDVETKSVDESLVDESLVDESLVDESLASPKIIIHTDPKKLRVRKKKSET